MTLKLKSVKTTLVGKKVPTRFDGHAGRAIEHMLEADGFIINRRAVKDNPYFEVKSRDLDATSAQTIGSMTLDSIKITAYKDSPIYEKTQQQLRVKTQHNVIVSTELYDFSGWNTQSVLEQAYELARQRIINGDCNNYIYGGKFGYFERTNKDTNLWEFRLNDGAFRKLEAMSKSNFNKLFEAI